MAESNATIGLRQDLADFFYHLDTVIYDLRSHDPARRQKCMSRLSSLARLLASIRRTGEWMVTGQPPPPINVVNNASRAFFTQNRQHAPNFFGTRFAFGCWTTREQVLTLLYDFQRGRSNDNVAAALQTIWDNFQFLNRVINPTHLPLVQRLPPLLPQAQQRGELRAQQQAQQAQQRAQQLEQQYGLVEGSRRPSQAGPIRTARTRARHAAGPYARPRPRAVLSSERSESSQPREYSLSPLPVIKRFLQPRKDPKSTYEEPFKTPQESIEEHQPEDTTDEDEYILIKAVMELPSVKAEIEQPVEDPMEMNEPMGEPVAGPVEDPVEEPKLQPQGVRTILLQRQDAPGLVRPWEVKPDHVFLGMRMRKTPIKEEPEEGELAPTPPPWNFTIHSILTQLTHAPHTVQTEQLPPGETFAGFKMPEPLGAPPTQKRKEVRFDSYDSYFGSEEYPEEDEETDILEAELEEQPSELLHFPPRIRRQIKLPLGPQSGTLVDTVEEDEIYVMMRMNDYRIKFEDYDAVASNWPPDVRVVRARHGRPPYKIRHTEFLHDDEVYIRARMRGPIKVERFVGLPELPPHSWVSPSHSLTPPPPPLPRPPASLNLMGRRSVMPWPLNSTLMPTRGNISFAPGERLPSQPMGPWEFQAHPFSQPLNIVGERPPIPPAFHPLPFSRDIDMTGVTRPGDLRQSLTGPERDLLDLNRSQTNFFTYPEPAERRVDPNASPLMAITPLTMIADNVRRRWAKGGGPPPLHR